MTSALPSADCVHGRAVLAGAALERGELALWLHQYSDFWYCYLWGDKDTFQLAWRKLGREWAMPARGPIDLMGLAMGQCDFDGRVLFQHRNGAKWSLRDNPRIPGFVDEAACLELLEALRLRLEEGRAEDNESPSGVSQSGFAVGGPSS